MLNDLWLKNKLLDGIREGCFPAAAAIQQFILQPQIIQHVLPPWLQSVL